MIERPILFKGRLVSSIFDGTKTQTRRLVKGHALEWLQPGMFTPEFVANPGNHLCRYGYAGDRLWVRETWRSWEENCHGDHDGGCSEHCHQTYVAYAATPRVGYRPRPDKARICYLDESTPLEANPELCKPWRPSIHMPRWASRIDLEIAEVRVQRLQDITEDDANAEGVLTDEEYAARAGEQAFPACPRCIGWGVHGAINPDTLGFTEVDCATCDTVVKRFAILWDSINTEGAPWSANPWVWAITFKRIRPEALPSAPQPK